MEIPEYQALTPLGGREATFRFRGRWRGAEVTWEATVIAQAGEEPLRPNFIEIPDGEFDPWPIRIGLDVAAVDHPTVLKAIIMVRNYKRLAVGRHEYGP
ncbi:hypothetical protein [Endothiovibrio diazotrophicus]